MSNLLKSANTTDKIKTQILESGGKSILLFIVFGDKS